LMRDQIVFGRAFAAQATAPAPVDAPAIASEVGASAGWWQAA